MDDLLEAMRVLFGYLAPRMATGATVNGISALDSNAGFALTPRNVSTTDRLAAA